MKKYIKGLILLSMNNAALLLVVSGVLSKSFTKGALIFYTIIWFVTFMLIWVAVGMGIERIKNEEIHDAAVKDGN